jgi:galactokinase/mevalonate kinase-like predicted kinase
MDPGCTNPFIDGLFQYARPYTNGGKLAGAGGGGFAIMIARDAQAAHELTALLPARYPGTAVGVWACQIPERGLLTQTSLIHPGT